MALRLFRGVAGLSKGAVSYRLLPQEQVQRWDLFMGPAPQPFPSHRSIDRLVQRDGLAAVPFKRVRQRQSSKATVQHWDPADFLGQKQKMSERARRAALF